MSEAVWDPFPGVPGPAGDPEQSAVYWARQALGEELTLSACPYRLASSPCASGCHSEPRCITEGPADLRSTRIELADAEPNARVAIGTKAVHDLAELLELNTECYGDDADYLGPPCQGPLPADSGAVSCPRCTALGELYGALAGDPLGAEPDE